MFRIVQVFAIIVVTVLPRGGFAWEANEIKATGKVFVDSRPVLVEGAKSGEGPAWDPRHGLFFSGGGGVTLYGLNGQSRMFLKDAGTNGLLLDASGAMLMCQPRYRRVSTYDLKTRKLRVLTDSYHGKPYNQPNDITVDTKGRAYFSDPKYGSRDGMDQLDDSGKKIEGVYRIDVDGSVHRIITHEVDRPNGLVVTPDDRYLFVADNNNNMVDKGERKLWRFDLKPNGTVDLASQKLLFDWERGRGPDGMVLDEKGHVYVAGGLNKDNPPYETAAKYKGGVYVFTPDGALVDFAPVPNDEVTNCTFGGKDLKTLYITAGGTLWKTRTKHAGQMPWPGMSR